MAEIHANREFAPGVYDDFFARGAASAERGEERKPPVAFWYSYEATCWFDGFDSAASTES